MPSTNSNGNIFKRFLTFLWTSILSLLTFPVFVANAVLGKGMSVEVQSCNNNEQKNEDGGLSEDDEKALESSWDLLWAGQKKPTRIAHGIQFFVILFKRKPEALKFFPQFEGVDMKTLATDPKLKAHALNVMGAIDNYVNNLDDKEILVISITNMLKTHQARGVGIKQMTWLVEVMHETLDVVYDGKCPQYIKDAWSKFFGVILDIAATVNTK